VINDREMFDGIQGRKMGLNEEEKQIFFSWLRIRMQNLVG